MNLQLYSRKSDSIIFAIPTAPYTVAFRTKFSPKRLNGVTLQNARTEVIYNFDNLLKVNDVPVTDKLSVRVTISGAPESSKQLQEILTQMASEVPKWATEHVILGFEPTTPPILPSFSEV